MQDLFAFVQLGFRHITDLEAMDHLLFLLALAAIYRPRDWRSALWVISAFTVGHSVTLAGIELGQIVVLALAAIVLLTADRTIGGFRRLGTQSALRLRVVAVSSLILVVAAKWAVERNPW